MPNAEPELLLDGLVFPEGPRWHDERLWFSDMGAHEVVAVDLEGNRETIVDVPDQPSGLGWLPDGRLLVVSMTDRKLFSLESDGLVEFVDMSELTPFKCNDMVVDATGRAYIGNFGVARLGGSEPAPTTLILVTPGGKPRVAADGLMFPNGTVVTPDGGTLIVAESMGRRLTAFDLEGDGSLSNRRVWAELDGTPDGICLDALGCIWAAVPGSPSRFIRVAEGGNVLDRIDLEERDSIACMLGGPERRTLFMLEALAGTGQALHAGANPERVRGPGDGRIRTVEVDVPGAGLP